MLVYVSTVDGKRERGIIATCIEGDFFQEILHHRVQSTRADVFTSSIEVYGHFRDALNRAVVKLKVDVVYAEKLGVLEHI